MCITKRKNWNTYRGSGTRWNNICRKHGYDFTTELLYESDCYTDFLQKVKYYNDLYDVANSEEFANVIPENGYDSGIYGKTNLEYFWENAVPEEKKLIYKRMGESIKKGHWARKKYANQIKKKISLAQKNIWECVSYEERLEKTKRVRELSLLFFANKNTQEYKNFCELKRKQTTEYMKSISKEELSRINSLARLNTSKENAEHRKLKIQQLYKTGKYNHIYEEMSKTRIGVNNPNATIIVWDNIRFTLQDFKLFCLQNNLTKEYVENRFNEYSSICYKIERSKIKYDTITCPVCNKQTNKKPSSFKRWHFENCRLRNNHESN